MYNRWYRVYSLLVFLASSFLSDVVSSSLFFPLLMRASICNIWLKRTKMFCIFSRSHCMFMMLFRLELSIEWTREFYLFFFVGFSHCPRCNRFSLRRLFINFVHSPHFLLNCSVLTTFSFECRSIILDRWLFYYARHLILIGCH